jgi:hypothetical protein
MAQQSMDELLRPFLGSGTVSGHGIKVRILLLQVSALNERKKETEHVDSLIARRDKMLIDVWLKYGLVVFLDWDIELRMMKDSR